MFLASGDRDRVGGKTAAFGEWRALFRFLLHAEVIPLWPPGLCVISGFLPTSEHCRFLRLLWYSSRSKLCGFCNAHRVPRLSSKANIVSK